MMMNDGEDERRQRRSCEVVVVGRLELLLEVEVAHQ